MGKSIDGRKVRNVKLEVSLIKQRLVDWDVRVITDPRLNGWGRREGVADGFFDEVNEEGFLIFKKVAVQEFMERFFWVPVGIDNIF